MKRSAFTIVELIFVVGISVILWSVILGTKNEYNINGKDSVSEETLSQTKLSKGE